jgi:hypothetical protein
MAGKEIAVADHYQGGFHVEKELASGGMLLCGPDSLCGF